MKKLTRKDYLNRAIAWSLKAKGYKDTLELISRLKAQLCSYKLSFHTIGITENEINAKIKITEKQIHNNIMHLFYFNLKIPEEEKVIFGDTIHDDFIGIDTIDEKSKHYSIPYISSSELRQGYIEFTCLYIEGLEIKKVDKILNLTTGEFVDAANINKCSPVITSALVIKAITLSNY